MAGYSLGYTEGVEGGLFGVLGNGDIVAFGGLDRVAGYLRLDVWRGDGGEEGAGGVANDLKVDGAGIEFGGGAGFVEGFLDVAERSALDFGATAGAWGWEDIGQRAISGGNKAADQDGAQGGADGNGAGLAGFSALEPDDAGGEIDVLTLETGELAISRGGVEGGEDEISLERGEFGANGHDRGDGDGAGPGAFVGDAAEDAVEIGMTPMAGMRGAPAEQGAESVHFIVEGKAAQVEAAQGVGLGGLMIDLGERAQGISHGAQVLHDAREEGDVPVGEPGAAIIEKGLCGGAQAGGGARGWGGVVGCVKALGGEDGLGGAAGCAVGAAGAGAALAGAVGMDDGEFPIPPAILALIDGAGSEFHGWGRESVGSDRWDGSEWRGVQGGKRTMHQREIVAQSQRTA